jgi:hypothetical protein
MAGSGTSVSPRAESIDTSRGCAKNSFTPSFMFAFQVFEVWKFVFSKTASPVSPRIVSRQRFALGEFPPDSVCCFPETRGGESPRGGFTHDRKETRVLLAEGAPGEAPESLRALYPGPDSTLELSVVVTLSMLVATIELAAPETIFLELSLGRPDPLEAVRRARRAAS